MSQNDPASKTAKPPTGRGRRPKASPPAEPAVEPPQCHVHDNNPIYQNINEIRRNVCVNDEPPAEFEGKHYCLFHLPTKKKDIDKFEKKLRERLTAIEEKIAEAEKLPEDRQKTAKKAVKYDFRYVWFPSITNFFGYKFALAADFSSAIFTAAANFNAATFTSTAYFMSATFTSTAYFGETTFTSGAYFSKATFTTAAYFRKAIFTAAANFSSATFEEKSQVFFFETRFSSRLSFNYTVFKGYLAFAGKWGNRLFVDEESLLDLQNARVGDGKKILFHTVRVEPSWFVNTDASEFVFTDCEWNYADGKRLDVKRELKNLEEREFENPHALLTKACWQLADNHEESKSFADASLFRQFACESRRLKNPWYLQPFTLLWWYYAVSFYGERWTRAFFMLIGILALFGLLYAAPFSRFDYGEKKREFTADPVEQRIFDAAASGERFREMDLGEGLIHSLYVAALQRPEPKPASDSDLTKLFVILETIFAPLQAALLALAIRRKFMR